MDYFISVTDQHAHNHYVSRLLLPALLFFFVFIIKIYGQPAPDNKLLQYTSPRNGSEYVTRESNIIIRYTKTVLKESVSDSAIIVAGSTKGRYQGKLCLCRDAKTLIFEHPEPFEVSEKITVKVPDGLLTDGREMIPGFEFCFHVTNNKENDGSTYAGKKDTPGYEDSKIRNLYEWPAESYSRLKSVYKDFPAVYSLRSDNPSDGYYFLEKNYPGYCYLMIVDNFGTPVYYRVLEYNAHNFSLQPAGYLSFYNESERSYAILDSLYNIAGMYFMKNGYYADSHDFILMENGHSFMMAYDRQLVGMDKVIEGGDPDATVVGLVIQELDEDQNLVFQWRSWDHFNILDTDESVVNLYSQYVDYVHGNSLDVDSDTSLLLCSKNMNEVTKINRQTGEIIWRLGGKHNQFTFINDNKGFAMQHSAKKLKNGNLVLFDNGRLGEVDYSRGVEYELDETNYTAHLVNEFKHDSNVVSLLMGHIQRLSNGNTLISWGKNLGDYVCTEFNSDGAVTNDIYTEDDVKSYRVYKFDWNPKIIELDKEILVFDTIKPYYTDTKEIRIFNTTGNNILINGYSRNNTPFYTATAFPIVIPQNDSRVLKIKFVPLQSGEYNDIMTIYSDGLSDADEEQRIAVQFNIKGVASWDATPVKRVLSRQNRELQIYPNPVSERLLVFNAGNMVYLAVRDIHGKVLILKVIRDNGLTEIDCSGFYPGIYMLELTDGSGLKYSTKFIKR
jgi:hypothetical protein